MIHPQTSASEKTRKRNFTRNKVIAWILVAAWAIVIFLLSGKTSTGLVSDLGVVSQVIQFFKDVQASIFGPQVDILSSIGHFLEYALLGFALTNALRHHMPLKRAWIVALICASAYGITDEFHQYFVPERMCDPVDWLVDTAGATLGAWTAKRSLNNLRNF